MLNKEIVEGFDNTKISAVLEDEILKIEKDIIARAFEMSYYEAQASVEDHKSRNLDAAVNSKLAAKNLKRYLEHLKGLKLKFDADINTK